MLSTFIIGFCLHLFYNEHVTPHEPVIESIPQVVRIVERINTTVIAEPEWPCSTSTPDHSVCILLISLLSAFIVLGMIAWIALDSGNIAYGLDSYYDQIFGILEPDSILSIVDAASTPSNPSLSSFSSPERCITDGIAIEIFEIRFRLPDAVATPFPPVSFAVTPSYDFETAREPTPEVRPARKILPLRKTRRQLPGARSPQDPSTALPFTENNQTGAYRLPGNGLVEPSVGLYDGVTDF